MQVQVQVQVRVSKLQSPSPSPSHKSKPSPSTSSSPSSNLKSRSESKTDSDPGRICVGQRTLGLSARPPLGVPSPRSPRLPVALPLTLTLAIHVGRGAIRTPAHLRLKMRKAKGQAAKGQEVYKILQGAVESESEPGEGPDRANNWRCEGIRIKNLGGTEILLAEAKRIMGTPGRVPVQPRAKRELHGLYFQLQLDVPGCIWVSSRVGSVGVDCLIGHKEGSGGSMSEGAAGASEGAASEGAPGLADV
ncbi:hypothetical protein B0H11DRAFT_1915603 [Mycena galericulata]|nr:hypothetical protein B0H11DRAFT_1915603 [Mycena galericulata]